jgi:asparagine synthase (glutamine-hydrolysing)
MSALAGVLEFGTAASEHRTVEAITAAQAHSGPDGIAHWHGRPMALGHCMLRTTPEAQLEVQPLRDETSGLVLVFDGRLDNRADLASKLAAQGARSRSDTDAELVLRAHEQWGHDAPRRLLGDFAYAIWDENRQALFCATDPMGACPLFYARTDRRFAFASMDEALLVVPGVDANPADHLIAHLLVPGYLPEDRSATWLQHVKSLPAGHSMTVTAAGNCEVTCYSSFKPGEELRFASHEEAKDAFMKVFGMAVRDRLRSSGPVAQMLSGGLDSASIHEMATQVVGTAHSLQTYSTIYDDPQSCIETACIQSMVAGPSAHFVSLPSLQGPLGEADLARELWGGAHPRENSIPLPALMCLAASRNGHRVMLHGVTGDVAQAVPNRYIADVMKHGHWNEAWTECKAASEHHSYLRGTSPWKLFAANAATAFVPGSIKASAQRWRPRASPLRNSAINRDFARRLSLAELLDSRDQRETSSRQFNSSVQEQQAMFLNGRTGPSLGLSGYSRLGKRYGMELRDPWGDQRVVQFFLDLPLKYKVGEGWTKHLVRDSFASLPPVIRWRVGKEHLGGKLVDRLVDGTRNFLLDLFAKDLQMLEPYIDVKAARERIEQQDKQFVYEMAGLILWMKRLPKPGEFR